jgi:hypothetical protein
MSRQMECQLSGPQIIEWGQKALDMTEGIEGKYETFGQWLDAEVPDKKIRARLGTALVVLSELSKEGLTANDVRQVIRWRNDNGDPGAIEIQYNKSGTAKRAVQLREQQRLQDLRTALRMLGPGILFR